MRPPVGVYGSCDVCDDGLVVCAEWQQKRVWFGDQGVAVPEPLLFLRAALVVIDGVTSYGASAHGHDTGTIYFVDRQGAIPLGVGAGNQSNAIQAIAGAGFAILWMDNANPGFAWRRTVVAVPERLISNMGGGTYVGPTPNDANPEGMLDASPTGPIWTPPIFRPLAGYEVGFPCTRPNAAIGVISDDRLADGLLLVLNGTPGTLVQTGDVFEPHLSANGQWWCGWQHGGGLLSGTVPAVAPPLQPRVLATFTHPVTIVVFKDPAGQFPAHHEVVVNVAPNDDGTLDNAQQTTRPCWAPLDSLAGIKGPLVGIYCEQREDFAAVLAAATARGVRAGFCWDSDQPLQLPAGFRAVDTLLIECYRYKSLNESLAQAESRWTTTLATARARHPGDLGVCLQLYCMNGVPNPPAGSPGEDWTVAEVEAIALAGAALVNTSEQIRTVWLFEYLRGNGMSAHPELRALGTAIAAASPGPAMLTPISAPIPQPSPIPAPTPAPEPEPEPMQLPAKCFALSHLSTPIAVNFDAKGPRKLDLHYPTVGFGAYQEVEVIKSTANPSRVLVRFTGSNQLFRVDRGDLARNPATLEQALSIWDATRPDADTEWQQGELVGAYVHFYGDGPNGLHGVLYTLTLVDGTGKLFR